MGLRMGRVIQKIIIKIVQTASLLATQASGCGKHQGRSLAVQPDGVNCGVVEELSMGTHNRKSRLLYPCPWFLSSTTWSSLPKKHTNGLIIIWCISTSSILVGWLCLTSHRQQGHLKTAFPFTVPCEGHEARFLHHSHRELNRGPSRVQHSYIHYLVFS